jgi:hypothetical protein
MYIYYRYTEQTMLVLRVGEGVVRGVHVFYFKIIISYYT